MVSSQPVKARSMTLWNTEKIRDLILIANQEGIAEARTEDPDAARRLRFTIYNYRKRNLIGNDLVVTVDGSSVILRKPRSEEFQIINDEQSPEEE